MVSLVNSKKVALFILIIFSWFTFSYAYSFSSQEDSLEKKVLKYFYEGNYEGAIEMLNEYIKQIVNIKKKRVELAEAYYHLAKTFYKVGLDDQVQVNLKEVYKAYPRFEKEELDADFLKMAKEAQRDILLEMEKNRAKEAAVKEKTDKPQVKKETDKKTDKPKAENKKEEADVIKEIKKPVIKKTDTKASSGIKVKEGEKKKKKFPILIVALGVVAIGVLVILLSKGETDDVEGIIGINILHPVNGAVVGDHFTVEFRGWSDVFLESGGIWVIGDDDRRISWETVDLGSNRRLVQESYEWNHFEHVWEEFHSDTVRIQLEVRDVDGKTARSKMVRIHRH